MHAMQDRVADVRHLAVNGKVIERTSREETDEKERRSAAAGGAGRGRRGDAPRRRRSQTRLEIRDCAAHRRHWLCAAQIAVRFASS